MKRATTTLGEQVRGRSDRLTGALEVVGRALEPLTAAERARVMRALAVFFGIDLNAPPEADASMPVPTDDDDNDDGK